MRRNSNRYIGQKVSNGYSKLGNYQLGSSGFQIKNRKRSSRSKKNRIKRDLYPNVDKDKCTNNRKNNKTHIKEDRDLDVLPRSSSHGLFTFPKILWGSFYKKIVNYAKLHDSHNENVCDQNTDRGPNRISVLNQDASDSGIKGNSNILSLIKLSGYIF